MAAVVQGQYHELQNHAHGSQLPSQDTCSFLNWNSPPWSSLRHVWDILVVDSLRYVWAVLVVDSGRYLEIVRWGFCLNFGEWMAMIFLVYRIELNKEWWYYLVALMIFAMSLFLSFRFFLGSLHRQQALGRISPRDLRCLARFSNLLVVFLTLITVIVYFFCVAIPLYNSTTWAAAVEFEHEIRAPAVLVCGGYNDAISAQQKDGWKVCKFPEWSEDGSTDCKGDIKEKLQNFSTTRYGTLKCYNFRVSRDTKFNTTSKELLVQTLVTWNSNDIEHFYKTKAPPGPSLYSIFYDSRMSLNDLSQVIDCGLLSFTEIPAIDFKTVNIRAVKVKDKRGIIASTGTKQHCRIPTLSSLYQDKESYITYQFQLSSSSSAYGHICDIGPTGKQVEYCINQMIFHFETFLVETDTSEPGIGRMEISTDMGGIVGAVTFFLYFLTVFAA